MLLRFALTNQVLFGAQGEPNFRVPDRSNIWCENIGWDYVQEPTRRRLSDRLKMPLGNHGVAIPAKGSCNVGIIIR